MPDSPENDTLHTNIARLLEIRALTAQFGAPSDRCRDALARESMALAWRLFDRLAGWTILHQLSHAMSQKMIGAFRQLKSRETWILILSSFLFEPINDFYTSYYEINLR